MLVLITKFGFHIIFKESTYNMFILELILGHILCFGCCHRIIFENFKHRGSVTFTVQAAEIGMTVGYNFN